METKLELYNQIMKYLTAEQKKGIIPIVQECESALTAANQKFEFDLFGLPPSTFDKLQDYINESMHSNLQTESAILILAQHEINIKEHAQSGGEKSCYDMVKSQLTSALKEYVSKKEIVVPQPSKSAKVEEEP